MKDWIQVASNYKKNTVVRSTGGNYSCKQTGYAWKQVKISNENIGTDFIKTMDVFLFFAERVRYT